MSANFTRQIANLYRAIIDRRPVSCSYLGELSVQQYLILTNLIGWLCYAGDGKCYNRLSGTVGLLFSIEHFDDFWDIEWLCRVCFHISPYNSEFFRSFENALKATGDKDLVEAVGSYFSKVLGFERISLLFEDDGLNPKIYDERILSSALVMRMYQRGGIKRNVAFDGQSLS